MACLQLLCTHTHTHARTHTPFLQMNWEITKCQTNLRHCVWGSVMTVTVYQFTTRSHKNLWSVKRGPPLVCACVCECERRLVNEWLSNRMSQRVCVSQHLWNNGYFFTIGRAHSIHCEQQEWEIQTCDDYYDMSAYTVSHDQRATQPAE